VLRELHTDLSVAYLAAVERQRLLRVARILELHEADASRLLRVVILRQVR